MGTTSPERVNEGMLLMVERAIAGTHFAWGAMLLTKIVPQLWQVVSRVN